jgi:hypothetical protein
MFLDLLAPSRLSYQIVVKEPGGGNSDERVAGGPSRMALRMTVSRNRLISHSGSWENTKGGHRSRPFGDMG